MPQSMFGSGVTAVLDAMSDGVYVVTDEREIVYWSAGAERLTGYASSDVVGSHCYDDILVHTDMNGKQLCLAGCPLAECIQTGRPGAVNEVFLKRKDGQRLAVYVKTSTFEDAGHTYGVEVFGELESVAGRELAERVQELSDASITDPLSGLFNRRYFDASLEQQFEMFRRIGRRYGLLYLDIDRFKNVNDVLGHAVGDEAIRFVADVLSRNARKMDVAARYGGDEFAVVCAVATSGELETYGRRLVTMMHESRFAPAEKAGLSLTVTVGGTMVEADDADARAALGRADQAMLSAKRAGRDALVVAAPPE